MAVNVNTAIYDKAVDRAAMVRLYEKRINGKIELVINGHALRVDKLIKDAYLSDKGFETLREAIDKDLRKTYREAYNVSSRSLLDFVTDQTSYTYQNLENTVGKIWRTKKPQRRIAENIVLEQPLYKNVTLASGWAGVSLGERKRIEQVIRKGLAEGLSNDQIALAVRKGNVYNISRNQSKALVTTAITSVHAQVDNQVYKANEKALQGWQYVSILDSKTTEICAHRDGTVYAVDDMVHLPPAHFNCRSTTIPVVKSWEDLSKLEGIAQIRKRNLEGLTPKQIQFYDGQTSLKESYNEWLIRQPTDVQLRHVGDFKKLELFRSGQLTFDKFVGADGVSVGIRELRRLTDSGYAVAGDTRRFAIAKEKLDAIKVGASTPDDFIDDIALQKALKEYYVLQAGELDGNLSLINYRGKLLFNKKATKTRVLSSPPSEANLVFNPITGRYDDNRMYQPTPAILQNALRLIDDSNDLKQIDKDFINKIVNDLEERLGTNERAVIADNLRIVFSRYRRNPQPWANFKAVVQSQLNFDIMNISDNLETQLRKGTNLLRKLKEDNFIDPVLGPTQLDELGDNLFNNIFAKNRWEEKTAPKIAKQLRGFINLKIPLKIRNRINDKDLELFYLKFAQRLSLADMPDRDQFAVALGRDLYNMANYRGSRNEWWKLGSKLLEDAKDKGIYELETYGVQKRRMRSRMSGTYFGPYYDTFAVNIRIVDPRIQEYSQLTRKVDVGLRVSVTNPKNRLIIREGFKTYFIDRGILGYYDTRIPITSTSSFSDFPEELVDKAMVKALNWAGKTEYKIDNDYYDFVNKLLFFEDDKGKAKLYNDLNEYKSYIAARGDAYERFKTMEWLRSKDLSFSNVPFLDHRARIYERGFIGPQSGETFRPFLNTLVERNLGTEGYLVLQDQIGSFLGGLSDVFEGNFNSLTFTGRQKIATKWKSELVKIGNHALRGKPNDIRAILESDIVHQIDGEELGKFYRFAIEVAKIDNYLNGNYSKNNLSKLNSYKTSLALEQDASSSGAQIIALTTRNKQLAELSNVIPTTQKKRLYDEIAAATFNDPKFRELNVKLGLTEKDLRKAAKAQNMVTFYGAGERTGILNVEGKLAKVLNKSEGTLVVKAADRDSVLNEISARMARYERLDPELYLELKALRQDVRDIFNKGLDPGDDILEQLYFLEPKTRELVEKLSGAYTRTVTPDDFKQIAQIMSENLSEQVPVLKDFTKYFGRLAEDFLATASPADSIKDFDEILKETIVGTRQKQPPSFLEKLPWYKPNGSLSNILYGIQQKKLPKKWTTVPWVNFDGKTIEQNFTQRFEERLRYRDKDGNWITNILQVDQKTDPTWWEELTNKQDTINDIADATKARTAFAVNGNHSNDATLVKQFHIWGAENNIPTSTIHDAFFTNISDMQKAKRALRQIYANALNENVIRNTLREMRKRGLSKELYDKYLNEAIEIGLIPIVGRSRIGGKLLTDTDILLRSDILKQIDDQFIEDLGWYGIGG